MRIGAVSRGLLTVVLLAATVAARPDRRIVDKVIIGDARSEQAHAYAGDSVTTGTVDGRSFRQARSWMRFALTVFDDTEVTIACTFLGGEKAQTFDLIVENRVVASHTFHSATMSTVEFRVPIEITRGHTNILVLLRATSGSTPPLVEMRSVQDHNE